MKKILLLNFLMLTFFNFAHPVTPAMMEYKNSPDALFGLFFMMMSLGTFLFSSKWGNKIDMSGTKKIMVMAPIGYMIGQMIFAFSMNNIIMLLGRLMAGAFASGWIVGTTSYINLISNDENRIRRFGYQLVAANLGGIVGQMLSGIIGEYNFMYSFYAQFLGLFTVAILALLLLKDLYPDKKVVDKVSLKENIKYVYDKHFILILMSMVMISMLSNTFMSTIAYFGADQLGFGTTGIASLNSYIALLGLISNLFLVKLLSSKLSFYKAFSLQIVIALIGGVIILVTLESIFILVIFLLGATFITLFSSMYRAFVQSYLINSKVFNPGQVLGLITSFNAIGMVGGSLTFSIFYPINSSLPFLVLLIYGVLSLVFLSMGRQRIIRNYGDKL